MKWFSKHVCNHRTCVNCGHLFDPTVMDYEHKQFWPELCKTCVDPKREANRREQAVVAWAKRNVDKLWPEVQKEREEKAKTNVEYVRDWATGGQQNFINGQSAPIVGYLSSLGYLGALAPSPTWWGIF